jgi:predicted SAM-dependent methyltransferase
MMNRNIKSTYYAFLSVPMRINALRHRLFPRYSKFLKVHLGSGQKNYLKNWINVDANLTTKIDIWADIRFTLPFRPDTVEALYSHHVIEHLPDHLLSFHFAEIFRVLKPGGVIRVGGPNADMAIKKFQEGDIDWFDDFPDRRHSIGGRLANFLLCKGEHLTVLTISYLTELATEAGFEGVSFLCPSQDTRFPAVFDAQVLNTEWESTPCSPHTLIMEAQKPLPVS